MVDVFTTENEVETESPKLTLVTPVKLEPVRVTVVPMLAWMGLKEASVGAAVKKVEILIVQLLLPFAFLAVTI